MGALISAWMLHAMARAGECPGAAEGWLVHTVGLLHTLGCRANLVRLPKEQKNHWEAFQQKQAYPGGVNHTTTHPFPPLPAQTPQAVTAAGRPPDTAASAQMMTVTPQQATKRKQEWKLHARARVGAARDGRGVVSQPPRRWHALTCAPTLVWPPPAAQNSLQGQLIA